MNKKNLLIIIAIFSFSFQFILSGKTVSSFETIYNNNGFEFPDPQGPLPLLVVLLEFSDSPAIYDPSVIRNEMFGPRPSMNDYWKETSYGNFYFIDNGFWKWIKAWDDPHTPENESTQQYWDGLSDYGAGKFRWWGIKSLYESENFNFTKFDKNENKVIGLGWEISYLIVDSRTMMGGSDRFLVDNDEGKIPDWNVKQSDLAIGELEFAGRGAVTHGGEIASANPFLVIAHELAHNAFNLEDYYAKDIDPESIEMYSLMGDPYGPHHLDAYSKYKLGWIKPTIVMSDAVYIIPDSETNPTAFILHDPAHGTDEYFLVENRFMGTSYDNTSQFLNNTEKDIQDQGLVIWHVDETKQWNGSVTGGYSKVQLLTMDGRFGMPEHYISSAFDGNDSDYYDFNDFSEPRNSRWWNGQNSGIGIYQVSESKKDMTAYFDIPGGEGFGSWMDKRNLHIDVNGSTIYKLNVENNGAVLHTLKISVENLNSSLKSSINSSLFLLAPGENRVFNIIISGINPDCNTPLNLYKFDVIVESTAFRVLKHIHHASLNTSFVDQHLNLVTKDNKVIPPEQALYTLYLQNGGNVDGNLGVEFEGIINNLAKADIKEIPKSWFWTPDLKPNPISKCYGNLVPFHFRIFVPWDWAGLTDTIYQFKIITISDFGHEVSVNGELIVEATPDSMLRYSINRMEEIIRDSQYQSLRILMQNAADKTEFAMAKYLAGEPRLAKNQLIAAQNEIFAYKLEVKGLTARIIDYKSGSMMIYQAEKLIGDLEQTKDAIFSDIIIGAPKPPSGGK